MNDADRLFISQAAAILFSVIGIIQFVPVGAI